MRARRLATVVCVTLVLAAVIATPASAAPTWGPQRTVDTWAWTTGSTLARDASGDLVALTTTDFSKGSFATDHGPYMGVFAQTSPDRGVTWSTPVRVSQPNRQADRAALAVSGKSMYAAWVTQRSYDAYDPSRPRILYFRADTGSGWGTTIALTKKKDRVDVPSVAAAGKRVYVAWTDANSGKVLVARSGNAGAKFVTSMIGKTTAVSPAGEGDYGYPSIGATGNVVVVAWISSGSGAVKARVSTNGGKTWQNAILLVGSLGFANQGTPSVRGWEGKLVVSWTTPAGLFERIWSKSWGATQTVATFGADALYRGGFDAQVVPFQGGQLGAVWSACRTSGCDTLSGTAQIDVVWSESNDGGNTWSPPSLVQGSLHADQRINTAPSAVWLDASTRAVGYTGRTSGWTSYAVFLRIGS